MQSCRPILNDIAMPDVDFPGPWLARNDGMDPYGSAYINPLSLFPFSIPSFPANQRPVMRDLSMSS